jgi:hypothetical protein
MASSMTLEAVGDVPLQDLIIVYFDLCVFDCFDFVDFVVLQQFEKWEC